MLFHLLDVCGVQSDVSSCGGWVAGLYLLP